ncbi:DgyrCDS3855 [Dimorphilus gyrociliatus]|uniref:DgyrCDS3855 n=1 Tax=Dimorphilus gyrociliatus TaxID=2664684 RepID=A0A7I8VEW8_9ANNE|nr:DgyrCDS3855 [Dimorphilus gyrociliatus]
MFIRNSNSGSSISLGAQTILSAAQLNHKVTDKDLNLLNQSGSKLQKFSINLNGIQKPESLKFLKDHPLEKLELKNFDVLYNLKDIEDFINVENLTELNLTSLSLSFKLNSSTCRRLKSLKKLNLNDTRLDDENFTILCKELPNLQNLQLKASKIKNESVLMELKKLQSLHFDNGYNSLKRLHNILIELKNFKELVLTGKSEINFDAVNRIFFESNWHLEKLIVNVKHGKWLECLSKRNLSVEKPNLKFCCLYSSQGIFLYDGKNIIKFTSDDPNKYEQIKELNDPLYVLNLAQHLKGCGDSFIVYTLQRMLDLAEKDDWDDEKLNIIWKIIFAMVDIENQDSTWILNNPYSTDYLKLINRMENYSKNDFFWIKTVESCCRILYSSSINFGFKQYYSEAMKIICKKWDLQDKVFKKYKMFRVYLRFFIAITEQLNPKNSSFYTDLGQVELCVQELLKVHELLFEKIGKDNFLDRASISETLREVRKIEQLLFNWNIQIEDEQLQNCRKSLENYFNTCVLDYLKTIEKSI